MPLIVETNYTLLSGQTRIGTNEAGLEVQVFTGLPQKPSPVVTIDGLLESHSSSDSYATAQGIRYAASNAEAGVIKIGASGVVRAVTDNPGGAEAYGLFAVSVVDLTNEGRIDVRSNDNSQGVNNTYADSRFVNRGVIEVRGETAYGIATTNGGKVLNTGLIDVTGDLSAVGVGISLTGNSTFENAGTIRVQVTSSSGFAYGVSISENGLFTNSGVIEAPIAVRLPTDFQTTRILNTGRLTGQLDLHLGVADLTNSGRIEGDVRMGAGADRYDGRLGAITGPVAGGDGADSLVGGNGAETLSGEAGDDTLDGGGGGTDRLDGGAGSDLLSFDTASQGVRLDLAGLSVSNGVTFSGFEQYRGSQFDDTILGSGGGDTIAGGLGGDTVTGGDGNDTITDTAGVNYLRGDGGNDSIIGGAGFDDINGNMGNDTCVSGGGDDWVVGGKDNDSLAGSAGQNLVYGNIGNDTCEGGDGNDIVRGGQDSDVIFGGAGDDYVSGDRGDDTISGGLGADSFHTFGEAGIDRVLDFNFGQGDRVQLDPGTQYTVGQSGEDTVINMTGGGQMVLVGVQMSTLTAGWIFGS